MMPTNHPEPDTNEETNATSSVKNTDEGSSGDKNEKAVEEAFACINRYLSEGLLELDDVLRKLKIDPNDTRKILSAITVLSTLPSDVTSSEVSQSDSSKLGSTSSKTTISESGNHNEVTNSMPTSSTAELPELSSSESNENTNQLAFPAPSTSSALHDYQISETSKELTPLLAPSTSSESSANNSTRIRWYNFREIGSEGSRRKVRRFVKRETSGVTSSEVSKPESSRLKDSLMNDSPGSTSSEATTSESRNQDEASSSGAKLQTSLFSESNENAKQLSSSALSTSSESSVNNPNRIDTSSEVTNHDCSKPTDDDSLMNDSPGSTPSGTTYSESGNQNEVMSSASASSKAELPSSLESNENANQFSSLASSTLSVLQNSKAIASGVTISESKNLDETTSSSPKVNFSSSSEARQDFKKEVVSQSENCLDLPKIPLDHTSPLKSLESLDEKMNKIEKTQEDPQTDDMPTSSEICNPDSSKPTFEDSVMNDSPGTSSEATVSESENHDEVTYSGLTSFATELPENSSSESNEITNQISSSAPSTSSALHDHQISVVDTPKDLTSISEPSPSSESSANNSTRIRWYNFREIGSEGSRRKVRRFAKRETSGATSSEISKRESSRKPTMSGVTDSESKNFVEATSSSFEVKLSEPSDSGEDFKPTVDDALMNDSSGTSSEATTSESGNHNEVTYSGLTSSATELPEPSSLEPNKITNQIPSSASSTLSTLQNDKIPAIETPKDLTSISETSTSSGSSTNNSDRIRWNNTRENCSEGSRRKVRRFFMRITYEATSSEVSKPKSSRLKDSLMNDFSGSTSISEPSTSSEASTNNSNRIETSSEVSKRETSKLGSDNASMKCCLERSRESTLFQFALICLQLTGDSIDRRIGENNCPHQEWLEKASRAMSVCVKYFEEVIISMKETLPDNTRLPKLPVPKDVLELIDINMMVLNSLYCEMRETIRRCPKSCHLKTVEESKKLIGKCLNGFIQKKDELEMSHLEEITSNRIPAETDETKFFNDWYNHFKYIKSHLHVICQWWEQEETAEIGLIQNAIRTLHDMMKTLRKSNLLSEESISKNVVFEVNPPSKQIVSQATSSNSESADSESTQSTSSEMKESSEFSNARMTLFPYLELVNLSKLELDRRKFFTWFIYSFRRWRTDICDTMKLFDMESENLEYVLKVLKDIATLEKTFSCSSYVSSDPIVELKLFLKEEIPHKVSMDQLYLVYKTVYEKLDEWLIEWKVNSPRFHKIILECCSNPTNEQETEKSLTRTYNWLQLPDIYREFMLKSLGIDFFTHDWTKHKERR